MPETEKSSPEPEDGYETHREIVTPELAAEYLEKCPFDRQRDIVESWVVRYQRQMVSGEWGWQSPGLSFCALGTRLYLVDGQHRLEAIRALGKPIELLVTTFRVLSIDDVASIYVRFDTGGRRTMRHVLRSLRTADECGLTEKEAQQTVAGLNFLRKNFSQSSELGPSPHEADRLVREWADEATAFFGMMVGPARDRFRSAPFIAIGLITLRHQPAKAAAFWKSVALNDALRSESPEQRMVEYADRRRNRKTSLSGEANRSMTVRDISRIWNAYYDGKERVGTGGYRDPSLPIRIGGTPYAGKASPKAEGGAS